MNNALMLFLAGEKQGGGSGGTTPTGSISITENGTHNVTQYAEANVAVEPALTTLNATTNGTYRIGEILAYLYYDGWDEVVVNVPTFQTGVFAGTGDSSKIITLSDLNFTNMLVYVESGTAGGYGVVGCYKPSSGEQFGIKMNSSGASRANMSNILTKTSTGLQINASNLTVLTTSCTYRWYVW